MITDPFGNRLIAAAHPLDRSQRVRYLLEVCYPCQTGDPVNGVPVADFFTPRYFDPVRVDRSRYSFTGALDYPLEIAEGGYLTWIHPGDSGLYQLASGDTEPVQLASLAQLARSSAPLRTIVDTNSRTPELSLERLTPASSAVAAFNASGAVAEASEGAGLRTAQAMVSLAAEAG